MASITKRRDRANSARGLATLATVVFLSAGLPMVDAAPASAAPTPATHSERVLHLRLEHPTAIGAGAREFRVDTPQADRLDALLLRHGPIKAISKLYRATGRHQIDSTLGAALNDYYVVRFAHDVDMQELVADLDASGLVASAYPEALPPPPPTTPSFTSLQTYRTAAPVGTNSAYAVTVPGGTGSNVKLVDIEYSWNLDHEDLANAHGKLVRNGTPADPFTDDNHGTAVVGEIDATNNSIGVTGAAYGVSLALVNVDNTERGYDVVGALTTAASITQPGDVIQIEQQAAGPNSGNFVPVEWTPEIYDAIRSLTSSGRIVVEPAGNGNENLDNSAVYGATFPKGKPDSGAIIVGAGERCGTGSPNLSRVGFSDYGARVNLQGDGDCVATTGYGDLYAAAGRNAWYTKTFNGTSSATPMVSTAAASVSSVYKARNGDAVLSPTQIRSILIQSSTPQNMSAGALSGHIGPYPDLQQALQVVSNAPTGVVATAHNASASVTWTAPASSGSPITGYSVTAAPGGATVSVDGLHTSATVTGLTNGAAYRFSVTSTTGAVGPSVPSLPSNAVSPAGPPGAPGAVHAGLANGKIDVSWSAPSANGSPITGFVVSGLPAGTTVSAAASARHAILTLAPGRYSFRVRAKNAVGTGPASAPSNAITIVKAQAVPRSGYWMLAGDGKVYGFGDAANRGNAAGSAVAIAPRLDGGGYWVTDAAGNVSPFGTAGPHGGHPALHSGETVSTISATPSGNGYWLFTNRGRAFAYGDAPFLGDMSGAALNGPVIASVATPTGRGYFMVGSDGGVFNFGDARFHGSTGNMRLNKPIVGISPTPDNRGYWLVASDGGVFAFNAPFRGSMGATRLAQPVNGLVAYGNGYLMVAGDGGVFDFSDTAFLGSLANDPPSAPVIGIAAFTTR
jgi:serine protease